MKDWSKVTIETDPCVGVTRRALSDIMEKIKTEVNRLSKAGEQFKHVFNLIWRIYNKTNFFILFLRTEENREIHR